MKWRRKQKIYLLEVVNCIYRVDDTGKIQYKDQHGHWRNVEKASVEEAKAYYEAHAQKVLNGLDELARRRKIIYPVVRRVRKIHQPQKPQNYHRGSFSDYMEKRANDDTRPSRPRKHSTRASSGPRGAGG